MLEPQKQCEITIILNTMPLNPGIPCIYCHSFVHTRRLSPKQITEATYPHIILQKYWK